MKVLLTGATGYIGRRLLPVLLAKGHEVTCLVRDKRRFDYEDFSPTPTERIEVIEGDLTKAASLKHLPKDIDLAYYLVHSMSNSYQQFDALESQAASGFASYMRTTKARQVIYLSGIVNQQQLSRHLSSRKKVESILQLSGVPLTVLRAAIIIGSGSASFEIIRDLVEKLPIMVAPKWLNTWCQPIAIRNVIEYLECVMLKAETFDRVFDIGGPDILTYRQMLQGYARVRGLKRMILTVPVLTPKLSSLWLYFVTSTSYPLARSLVDSMTVEVTCQEGNIEQIIPLEQISYEKALKLAFNKINERNIVSSWKDSISDLTLQSNFLDFVEVPTHGCLRDKREVEFDRETREVLNNLWEIGGQRGWYFGNFLWEIRGLIDKIFGGVGLRRGRRSPNDLKAGDALDFWRVLLADKEDKRLLLYAEMKLPGEAWLEFKIREDPGKKTLVQTATFRPLGLWGRIYWHLLVPFHGIIFPQMAKNIVKY